MINGLLKLILFFFINIFPKNDKILVFGDRAGLRFADNSRHLFLYINKYHKEFRPIWITKNKEVYSYLKKNNFEVYYSNSLRGIYFCLIANWHLFNFVEDDISKNITTYSKCILLWHGVLPKKVNKIEHKLNHINNFIFKKIKKFFLYPNKKLSQNLLNRFPKYKYELLISNLPRNIILKNEKDLYHTQNELDLIHQINKSKKKIYGYFPTWRQDGLEMFRDVTDLSQLDNLNLILEKNHASILLKKHMNSEKKDGDRRYNPSIENLMQKLKSLNNFIFVDYETDLNSILFKCDYLITDYSGVVFDFLLLDRPIIFYIPDYESFRKNNGFELDIIEKKIGSTAINLHQLKNLIVKNESIDNSEMIKNRNNLLNEIFSKNNNGIKNILDILNK